MVIRVTSLGELISPEAIALDREASDWEEAIRISGGLLESCGVADAEYTQAMIDSVHENGPYIVLTPGFAFAHARPSEAVHRTGMSWVRLAEPVEFGHKSNDPVTLVVALAALDSSTHQKAMASLAKLIGDPESKKALDEASTPEELHDLLVGGGAGGESTEKPVEQDGHDSRDLAAEASPAAPADDPPTCDVGLPPVHPRQDPHRVRQRSGHQPLPQEHPGEGPRDVGLDPLHQRGGDRHRLGPWARRRRPTSSSPPARSPVRWAMSASRLRVIENFTSTNEIDAALREMYDV